MLKENFFKVLSKKNLVNLRFIGDICLMIGQNLPENICLSLKQRLIEARIKTRILLKDAIENTDLLILDDSDVLTSMTYDAEIKTAQLLNIIINSDFTAQERDFLSTPRSTVGLLSTMYENQSHICDKANEILKPLLCDLKKLCYDIKSSVIYSALPHYIIELFYMRLFNYVKYCEGIKEKRVGKEHKNVREKEILTFYFAQSLDYNEKILKEDILRNVEKYDYMLNKIKNITFGIIKGQIMSTILPIGCDLIYRIFLEEKLEK